MSPSRYTLAEDQLGAPPSLFPTEAQAHRASSVTAEGQEALEGLPHLSNALA